MDKINFDAIVNYNHISDNDKHRAISAMEMAIKQAIPIILKEAADKADICFADKDGWVKAVDKFAILQLQNSTELKTKLGIT